MFNVMRTWKGQGDLEHEPWSNNNYFNSRSRSLLSLSLRKEECPRHTYEDKQTLPIYLCASLSLSNFV